MPNNQQEFIPVYLFLGFLEAGKTLFMQDALEDAHFANGERTLLLVCEEGMEEYDTSKFKDFDIHMHVIEDLSDLNEQNLAKIAKECGAERVMIEYNGMWQIQSLFDAMPDDWAVYQAVFIADATTFQQYNANMRSLVVDKLNMSELVYFNRVTKDMDTMPLHQIIRGVSRRTDIYYEYPDGEAVFDDIEDPLPFDVNAKNIVIEDRDFALWYRDIMEDAKKYENKTVTFKALAVKNPTFPPNIFAVGRHIMTCCVEDIQYSWIAAQYGRNFQPHKDHWVTVTGAIEVRFNQMQGVFVPMLHVTKLNDAEPPEQEVATFY